MWSESIGVVFALLDLRISDRNTLRQERFVSAHSTRGIAVWHRRDDEGGGPPHSWQWEHEAQSVQTMVD